MKILAFLLGFFACGTSAFANSCGDDIKTQEKVCCTPCGVCTKYVETVKVGCNCC